MFQKKKWYIVFFLLILCLSVSAALGENILKFPKKLTEIKAEAFYGDVSLQSVVLPEGINSIGDLAFANSSLAKINLPASLKYISKNAFDGCENFEISVVKGSYAFEWCKENDLSASITEDPETVIEYFTWEAINDQEAAITGYIGPDTKIKIPTYVEDYTITTIADCAFEYNDALSVVILADSIKKIGEYAFYGCSGLTEVVFGNSLNSIGDNAFSDCAQITNIEFPEGIEQIGSGAFWYCASIKEIELPNSISEIGSYAFAGCSSLVSVKLPSMVSIIAEGTFMDCTGMVEISIADGITEVGNYAFEGCVMLETIKLPESMDIIGTYAFMDCERLENVYLPDNITELGAYAFGNCVNLKSINIPMSWKWVVSNGPVFENCKELSHFVIPEGMESLPDYAFYRCTYLESIDLPSTLKRIGSFAFENCTKIKNIEIPDGVIEIGESAFSGCTGLGSIDLPECLKTIEHYAFKDCVGFTRIHLPAGIEKLRTGAFEGCINIENISIAEGLVKLPDAAFYGLEYLKNVELPSTLNWIGDYAFEDCTGITSIQFPDNVISIGESAFSGCVNLENISLPEGLLYIEFYAFKDCIKLTEIYLPDSITRLKGGAFSGCINLERINIPLNWRDTIGDTEGIFEGCNKLISIELPEGMEHLPAGAFSGCAYLENISMPSSLKSIGANAFYGCTGITSLTIPEGVVEIGNFAFDECVNLERLYLPSSVSDIGLMLLDCDNLRIDCEYGSCALSYAKDNSIPHYYLSMTGAQYPGSTVYQGDIFNFYGYVRSSESISSITASIYSVEQGKNVIFASFEPKTTESNLYQLLQSQFKLETLSCGEYIYTIGATAGEETETFVTSRFEVIPPPLRISTDMISVPLGSISQGTRHALDGNISSNYVITTAEIYIYSVTTEEFIQSCLLYPNAYSFNISTAANTINTSLLDGGKYLFFVRVTSNQERVIAYKNIFYVSTPTQKEARIRDFDKVFESSSISGGDMALCIESIKVSDAAYSIDSVYDNLKDLGFKSIETNKYSSGTDTVGHTIGWKDIEDEDGNTVRLLGVVCRGTRDAAEWMSNFSFTLTKDGFHGGFYRASQDVLMSLYSYINKHFPGTHPSDYKIWLTGHSRGAAVANILAGYLLPNISCDDNNIYAYTFACPSVSISALPTRQNIKNFNLGGDLVPRLPMESWGFSRYGWTVTYPNEVNEIDEGLISMENMDKIEGMLYELTGDRYVEITQRLYDTLTGYNNTNLVDFVFAFIDAAYFVQSKYSLAIPDLTKPDEVWSSKQFYEGLIALGFNAGSIVQTHSCSSYVTWIENWR